ncbi:hypothetical protein D822_04880 [Streptococcus ratti FA-1 = DSM 20564]|nr:hypothetical protein D822_04880 [Streptococcus ratti FA-1 = DSM 20564]
MRLVQRVSVAESDTKLKESEEHALISYLKNIGALFTLRIKRLSILLMTNNSGTTVFVCLDEAGAFYFTKKRIT